MLFGHVNSLPPASLHNMCIKVQRTSASASTCLGKKVQKPKGFRYGVQIYDNRKGAQIASRDV